MGKRNRYRDHVDPEYQRWGRTYPSFPGVAECVRLILDGKAKGAWADIMVDELATNAGEHLDELIATFRDHRQDRVAMFVMMAIELAALPSSVKFLGWVLQQGDSGFTPYAKRALAAIDTRESRLVLWEEGS